MREFSCNLTICVALVITWFGKTTFCQAKSDIGDDYDPKTVSASPDHDVAQTQVTWFNFATDSDRSASQLPTSRTAQVVPSSLTQDPVLSITSSGGNAATFQNNGILTKQDNSKSSNNDDPTLTKGDVGFTKGNGETENNGRDGTASSSSFTPEYSVDSTPAQYSVTTSPSDSSYSMVTRLGVRVQGDMPAWNADYQRFVSTHAETFDGKFRAVLDTVNMAAVEGALKYVQAECINASVVDSCERKNNVKYVVFYQTTVVQPIAAMQYYANATDEHSYAIEHCPFMSMDGGRCNPNEDGTFPDICNQYIGAGGQPKLGFCVGGTLQDKDVIAPYPHNYWFSFPNSCPQERWDDKTESCRKEYAGGLCAFGVKPDGVTCTFSYEILGYILLDDVVGITSMMNPSTGSTYANYTEFCEAGGVEFNIPSVTSGLLGGIVELVEGLEFWANPGDSDANAARIEKLVSAYDALVSTNAITSDGGRMRPLPTVADITAMNPPCYENSPLCAKSVYGCKRSYRSQICQICMSDEIGCEKP